MTHRLRSPAWLALAAFAAACTPPAASEPAPSVPVVPIASASGAEPPTAPAESSAIPAASAEPPASSEPVVVATGGEDPLHGHFTLADATADIHGSGALVATIETPDGALACTLYETKAPLTVANFVGLATGTRPWKNARGEWVKQRAYDGTTFHRIIKGFMIQGGDANGAARGRPGTGEPGYVVPDEIWAGATHDRAGLLCMANRGPNTNGMQFFITDEAAPSLDGGYTIFGECAPVSVIHKLAAWPVKGDQAVSPPAIAHVTVAREHP